MPDSQVWFTIVMFENLLEMFSYQTTVIQSLVIGINVVLHIIFAGAVAKDAGELIKTGQKTMLVSGVTWAFATLIGGVITAVMYWLIHHSKFTRH